MVAEILDYLVNSHVFILVNNYLQRINSNELLMNISYNFIYFFSKIQLFYIKCKTAIYSNEHIKYIVDSINKNQTSEKNKTHIIKYNDSIHIKEYSTEVSEHFESNKNDLYIFTHSNDYILSRSQIFNQDYEVSDIKFIMVNLQINDKNYKIDLKTETENYYIVQNILDKDFFLFYLFTHSNNYGEIVYEELKTSIENGIVKIIDGNADSLELNLNEGQSIVIFKNSYAIKDKTS